LADNIGLVSLDFETKIIENKKLIKVQGSVYFKKENKLMITYTQKPFETITFLNANGDIKTYDYESNIVTFFSNMLNSSEKSYLWYFFSGNFHDLGLSQSGYTIKETKIEEGILVTYWLPKYPGSPVSEIIIAKENNFPIYQEFRTGKNKVSGKIFFSNYMKSGEYYFPSRIVEIFYNSPKDSIVNIKYYYNMKTDKDVDTKWFVFKIPSNAKIYYKK